MTDKSPLLPLTSLRFFAAFSIVLFHAGGRWGIPDRVQNGVGVELFFVLSGFILAYNYRSIPTVTDGLRVVAYRVARIWPLHLTMVAITFAIMPANEYVDPAKLWAIIPLIQTWLGNYVYAAAGYGVSWTLSVELAFYLLFPLFTVLSSRAIVAVTAMIVTVTLLTAFAFRGAPYIADNVSAAAIMRIHPASFLVQFVAGMLACRLFLRRRWEFNFTLATVFELCAVGLVVYYYFAATALAAAVAPYWPVRPPASVSLFVHAYGALFFLPAIFFLAIGRGAVSRALSNPLLVYLGEISFATYMCHTMAILALQNIDLLPWVGLMAYLGTTLLGSVALYHGIERPAQRLIRGGVDRLLRPQTLRTGVTVTHLKAGRETIR